MLAGCLALAVSASTFSPASAAGPKPDDAQASAPRSYEYFAGSYYLDMGDRGDGSNVYAGLRYRPRERSLVYVQGDYLERFDKREGRLLGGASFRIAQAWNISGEVSLSPRAELYPHGAAWIELGRPVARTLALSLRTNYSAYRSVQLAGISIGSEYYPRGECAVISRVALARTDYGGGTTRTDGSALVKVIWFFDDRTRAFAYAATGSESFMTETIDRIGDLRANAFGVGGTWFVGHALGLSPSFEYQERERGPRYIQLGLEICRPW
jgi:YaiO family outer membrane protein